MNQANVQRENNAAIALMGEVAAFINYRQVSPAVALLALAKLIGQSVTVLDPQRPDELLDCAFHVARNEMRLRAVATRLQAAGLGAIMPANPV